MALDALHDTLFDARSLRGRRREPQVKASPAAVPQAQPVLVVIGAGLAALLLLAPMVQGSASLRPETGVAFLTMAAISLLAAAAAMQRALARARAAEQLLAAQNEAINSAGGIALRWQLVNGELTWNGNAARVLGNSPHRVPTNFRDLRPYLHPDDCLYNSISRVLRARENGVNWPIRIKDGESGWKEFSLTGKIGHDASTRHPVFGGVLMPAEEPAGSLTRAVESLPISFAIWDGQNRLVLCNRKFRQLYRIVGAASMRGKSFEEVQSQAREPIAQRPPEVQGSAGGFKLRDQQLSDGTWLQIGEYWTGDGTLVSVGTDITVSKHSERQVLEREQEMRAKVDGFEQSRRQLEIQARQLRELAESYNEEKIRAEAANQAKSEFLANVSHELRTPLNAIIGFSEMMRDGVLGPIGNPKYESYVKDIYASGRYLLEMINDILDMSKIEAGRMTLSPEWFTLSAVVDECLTVVHPSAIEGKVELLECGNTNVSGFCR